MKQLIRALLLTAGISALAAAYADEPPAEEVKLKDGSTLYLHPDGTGRMVDMHGKRMNMADGVPMETADGRMIMMKNKKIWVQYGPPAKFPPRQVVD